MACTAGGIGIGNQGGSETIEGLAQACVSFDQGVADTRCAFARKRTGVPTALNQSFEQACQQHAPSATPADRGNQGTPILVGIGVAVIPSE